MRALCLADREEMLQVLRDRCADVYDEMLGAEVKRGWS